MLRPHRDDDLVDVSPHAAARQHARADLLHQVGVVAQDQVGRPVADVEHRERFHAALAPVGGREQRGVELPVQERIRILLPVGRLDDVALGRGLHAQAARPVGHAPVQRDDVRGAACRLGRRRRADASAQHLRIDEVPAALTRDQIALAGELLVGEHDGVARDAERLGELAARRQRRPHGQLLVEDRRDQHLADLPLQADLGIAMAREQAVPHHAVRAVACAGACAVACTAARSVGRGAARAAVPCRGHGYILPFQGTNQTSTRRISMSNR